MNIYIIWDKCGRKWYVRSSYSFEACYAVNRLILPDWTSTDPDQVSSWDICNGLPQNATVIDAWRTLNF